MQLDAFRKGSDVRQETDIHGRRGAYFVADQLSLDAGQQCDWSIIADVNQGPADVANLTKQLHVANWRLPMWNKMSPVGMPD